VVGGLRRANGADRPDCAGFVGTYPRTRIDRNADHGDHGNQGDDEHQLDEREPGSCETVGVAQRVVCSLASQNGFSPPFLAIPRRRVRYRERIPSGAHD